MHHNPEQLAWRILLASFATFLALCGTIVYAAQWFVFQSTVDLDIRLTVARGTASVILPDTGQPIAVNDLQRDLEPGAIIQTDPNTQAVLTFSDPRNDQPIASVVIFRDSHLLIRAARAPRYGLNQSPYLVQIQSEVGRAELLVLDPPNRSTHLEIVTPHTFARIATQGQCLVNVSPRNTDITSLEGEAWVVESSSGRHVTLRQGNRTIIQERNSELVVEDAGESLLANSDFEQPFEVGWRFYNDREPPGTAYNGSFDGRTIVVIDRSQANWPGQALGHGETGLVQPLSVDVSRYRSLELRATFYIAEQSLSTCGIAGSECPMMLHMKYIDPTGAEQVYIHGFYSTYDPGLNYPMTCLTCRTDHERINLGSWYTYETGNLLSLLPASQRPVRITEVSFYASGHAYMVYVSEIELRAGH